MQRTLLGIALAAALVAPTAEGSPRRAAHECVQGNDLWFDAADGTRLVGHRFGSGTTAVILAHQSGGDLCEWVPYARELAAKGYRVFPIDFRGHGFSKFPRSRRGMNRLPADLAAAAKALRARGATEVHLVGASMGGLAALIAAANIRPPVDSVVSLSAPASYRGMNALPVVRRLTVPVLYVAAEDEAGGRFAGDARRLHAATAGPDKRLEIAPGTLHGVALFMDSEALQALVEDFLAAH